MGHRAKTRANQEAAAADLRSAADTDADASDDAGKRLFSHKSPTISYIVNVRGTGQRARVYIVGE